MPFYYTLHENTIRTQGQYRAVPKDVKYVTIDDAIAAITKPGSILKETECYAVIHAFLEYLSQQVEEGHGFASDYFRLKPGLQGVFESEEDAYDPARHTPSINFKVGKKMQQALGRMKVQKIDAEVRRPEIRGVEDWATGTKNQMLTPKGVCVVEGEHLKIQALDDPAQGVFLTHLATQVVYRVERIQQNYPKRLLIVIDDTLPPGEYRLEVRSSFTASHNIRIGKFAKTLVMEEGLK